MRVELHPYFVAGISTLTITARNFVKSLGCSELHWSTCRFFYTNGHL